MRRRFFCDVSADTHETTINVSETSDLRKLFASRCRCRLGNHLLVTGNQNTLRMLAGVRVRVCVCIITKRYYNPKLLLKRRSGVSRVKATRHYQDNARHPLSVSLYLASHSVLTSNTSRCLLGDSRFDSRSHDSIQNRFSIQMIVISNMNTEQSPEMIWQMKERKHSFDEMIVWNIKAISIEFDGNQTTTAKLERKVRFFTPRL